MEYRTAIGLLVGALWASGSKATTHKATGYSTEQPVKRKPTTNKPASCSTEKSCITCEHECVDQSSITTIIEHDVEILAHLEEKNCPIFLEKSD